eukprot:s132_g16.t1
MKPLFCGRLLPLCSGAEKARHGGQEGREKGETKRDSEKEERERREGAEQTLEFVSSSRLGPSVPLLFPKTPGSDHGGQRAGNDCTALAGQLSLEDPESADTGLQLSSLADGLGLRGAERDAAVGLRAFLQLLAATKWWTSGRLRISVETWHYDSPGAPGRPH